MTVVHPQARPRLLDLFCCQGGAAMGYHRAGFDVVGVDIEPQPRYPFEFHRGDALHILDCLIDGDGPKWLHEQPFDVVHASPPCQAYVAGLAAMNASMGRVSRFPKLIAPTRAALIASSLPYVIENVPTAPLRNALTLCGSSFGLRVRRHRKFESNVHLFGQPCRHRGHDFVGVFGDHPQSATLGTAIDGYERKPRAATVAEAQDAMGMPWADWNGCREAIPPAYAEFVGAQLIEQLARAA